MKRPLLFLSLVAFCLAACAPLQRADLNSARRRWNAAHLTHYRYTLDIDCFSYLCQVKMPISVEARSDGTILMVASDGTPLTDDDKRALDQFATIPGLFDYVEQDMKYAAQYNVAFGVTYDAKYGFPTWERADGPKGTYDNDTIMWITDFQPLP
jgi:hypothetical protein